MNNAVYGKTMENSRNGIDVKPVNNEKDYLKCTSKPSYILHKIFDNNLVVIRKTKVSLYFSKPAYIEMSVLGLSKVLMYEFHYGYIKNKYDKISTIHASLKSHKSGLRIDVLILISLCGL